MSVKIPEKLLYEMIDLLTEPKSLRQAKDECVLHLSKRNHVLDQLLLIRRNVLRHQPMLASLSPLITVQKAAQVSPEA